MPHIYKCLDTKQVVSILKQYQCREIAAKEARLKLGLGKTQFFALYKRYAEDEQAFELSVASNHARHRIGEDAERSTASTFRDRSGKRIRASWRLPLPENSSSTTVHTTCGVRT